MMPIRKRFTALYVLAAFAWLFTALPSAAAERDPFAGGSRRASVLIGNGYAFNESYLVVGVGVGYFAARGFELALDLESWTGSDPGITKLSPSIRYVVPTG